MTNTEPTTAPQYQVYRMKSGMHVGKGKKVATFDTAKQAVKWSVEQDEGRNWSDDWHQVKRAK